jgi:excisionase family DNA binding protein
VETLVQKLLTRTGLLSIAEISELLGFHEVTLRNWVRDGKLPAVRIGGQWRFDPTELAGSADPSVTLGIYSHVIGDSQRRAVEKVAGILDYSGLQTGVKTELIQ